MFPLVQVNSIYSHLLHVIPWPQPVETCTTSITQYSNMFEMKHESNLIILFRRFNS